MIHLILLVSIYGILLILFITIENHYDYSKYFNWNNKNRRSMLSKRKHSRSIRYKDRFWL
jgi:hypothetical protein